jgi:hypothetical protein
MDVQEKDNQDYGIYFLLAVLCGMATAWVISESILGVFAGALIGLLITGVFVNAFIKGKRD